MSGSFFASFLAGEARATGLLPSSFRDPAARAAHARRVARPIAPELVAALRAQEETLPDGARRRERIDALARGASCVVTGQQVGLFLGPLYTIYKAATAIAAARAIEAESGRACVPIFWLQTEDHDFEEINHCWVARADGPPLRLAVDEEPGADAGRCSVAHRVLPDAVSGELDRLDEAIGKLPHAAAVRDLFGAHYRPGASLARAFAATMATLFADDGLVIFDPRDAAVARLLSPLMRAAETQCDAIAGALGERSAALAAAGFETQVHVRARSPLFFLHPDGASGPRFRVERAGEGWSLVGRAQTLAAGDLRALLDGDPLCGSTSALLRPVAQDTLFPTAAYVAGPGEIAYFAQLAPLYAIFDLPPPLVVPRARFRITDGSTRALLEKIGFAPRDAARPREELLADLAARALPDGRPTPEALAASILDGARPPLDALDALVPDVDPNLSSAVRRTRETIARAAGRLSARYGRSLRERDRVASERIDRLLNFLHPNGVPQERFYALPYFMARFGAAALLEKVRAAIDPFGATDGDLALVSDAARPLKIGITCYPTFGGSGIIATEVGLSLARRGHAVHFICYDVPCRLDRHVENVFFHEVEVRDYPLFQYSSYPLALASKMVEVATWAQLDLLHVHYAIPHATSAYLARQILGARAPRIITTLHGTDITLVGGDRSFLPITRFSIVESDAITVPSSYLKEATYQNLDIPRDVPIAVIPNFVDEEKFRPLAQRRWEQVRHLFPEVRADDAGAPPLVVHNSNFRSLKRVDDVVRIFAETRRAVPGALLALVGDGPERSRVETMVRELGLANSVCFLGKQLNFLEVLQAGAVFLLPSESESFGLAALEALACGVPVVASRVGGLPELVTDGEVGFLAPVGDVSAMAASVARLLGDATLHARMANEARRQVVAKWRREPAVDRYEAECRRVVATAR